MEQTPIDTSNLNEYIHCLKNIESALLGFIEKQNDIEENFQNLIRIFEDYKISEKTEDLKEIFYMITHTHTVNAAKLRASRLLALYGYCFSCELAAAADDICLLFGRRPAAEVKSNASGYAPSLRCGVETSFDGCDCFLVKFYVPGCLFSDKM